MEHQPQPNQKRIVVCGGVCTSYFLAKKGNAVTLIEKSSVACAASGKAGGFLSLDWCDGGPVGPLARASFDLHRSLYDELNGGESYGYRPLTTLNLTIDESKPSISRSGSKPSSIPNWIDGPIQSPKSIRSTRNTAQVHPQMFTRTLLNTAIEKFGLELVIGKVENVRVEGDRVRSVVIEGGSEIEADSVVLALGPWSWTIV